MTRNGYLWTNALNYAYLFNIGEAAANKIIDYAESHSEKAEYEPYRNVVFGTITEIADGRLTVENDDATYTVPLDDLRISRYVGYGVVDVGDAVQVVFEGEIDENKTISGAVSLARAVLSPEGGAKQSEEREIPQ